MLLYCKDGVVLEWTADDAPARWALLAEGAVALPWPRGWDLEGEPPRPRMIGFPPRHAVPVYARADIHAAAGFLRWVKETGGLSVGGLSISTSDRSKLLIFGAADVLDDDDTTPVPIGDGSQSVVVTGVQMRQFKTAIGLHVAACFAAWNAIRLRIEAGEITTLEQLYAAPEWPA